VLVVIVQNHDTDCMRMLDHFFGQRLDLSELRRGFEAIRGEQYEVDLETVPAHVVTPEFDVAYTVAEFMLNALPMPRPTARRELEEYVRKHLADPKGGYRFSCDQDMLQIRRRS
jgi:hypothetical protein